MACSRCGSTTSPLNDRCRVCGAPRSDETRSDPPVTNPGSAPTIAGAPTVLGGDPGTRESATGAGGTGAATILGAGAPPASDAPTVVGTGPTPSHPRSASSPLSPGEDFGARYHIIRLLGIGGMGAVYQAWDKVLEVAVAIKVIRPPETMNRDEAEEAEKRFKRELLLARKVTHKNVVRIHDIGEIDGITYITMPYVQGSDLLTIIRKEGRLAVDRAVAIARQVASGLEAAHEAGIVHRDLKPANIMVGEDGETLIMDFGIARSTTAGLTMTVGGAVVGTIEYMSPEQARGGAVDQRVDIYAFGLILNDMLLGRRQTGAATSAVGALMERIQQAPAPVRSVDPAIPASLDALITKCLQPSPEDRYQTMTEDVAELESPSPAAGTARTATATGRTGFGAPAPRSGSRTWLLAGAAVLAVLAGVGWIMRDQLFRPASATPATAGPVISIAILPFRNDTGDATLDSAGTGLSELLRTQLGESLHVRTVPSARLQQALRDLRMAPNANLAPPEIRSVADFTSARRVVWGSLTRLGDSIRIDATLENLDGTAVALSAMAPNQTGAGLISAVSSLADQVRQNLATGAPDILAELKKTSWKPSTTSFEALRLYSEGQVLTQQGSNQEALKRYEEATQKDGEFALAYSALARSYASLRKETEAAKFSQQALDLSAGLPNPQERYLIQANHYRMTNQIPKAIEAYENLAKASPNSVMVQFDLGGLYEQAGQLEKAEQYFADVVKLDPKFVEGLLAVGRVQIKRTNYQASLDPLGSALNLAISFGQEEARGNILQAIGVAYRRLDRPEEALKHFSESLEIKRKLGNKGGMASSLGEIAVVQMLSGKPREAEESYNAALALQREIGDKAGVSVTLINLAAFIQNQGHPDKALPLLREALQLRRDAGNPAGISLVLNNIGSVYLATGQYSEAQTNLEQALALREAAKTPAPLADTLHNLAETLSKLGRYDQSLAHYVRALDLRRNSTPPDRRGAALESFAMGTIFDYQARYGAAVKAKGEALQTFRDLKVRDRWLGETLSGYGNSLSLAGRLTEAETILAEALEVARELKNPNLTSQTLRFQADRLWYAGDLKGASALAQEAAQAAVLASDKSHALLAQSTVSMTAAALQPSTATASRLGALAQEAEKAGLQALAVASALHRAETLLQLNSRAAAKQEADRALAKAETLGFRLLRARAQYVRAELLRAANDPGARRAYADALRVLDEIAAEDGSQDVLTRADLGPMHAACTRWSKAQ